MSKERHFTVTLNKQRGKWAQTLFKSKPRYLYHLDASLQNQLSLRKFLLVIWKSLRLILKIFTADDKYSVLNRHKLTQPIQKQLSQKQQIFLNFFVNLSNLD